MTVQQNRSMSAKCSYCKQVTKGEATHCGGCGRWFGASSRSTVLFSLKTEHGVSMFVGLAAAALLYLFH